MASTTYLTPRYGLVWSIRARAWLIKSVSRLMCRWIGRLRRFAWLVSGRMGYSMANWYMRQRELIGWFLVWWSSPPSGVQLRWWSTPSALRAALLRICSANHASRWLLLRLATLDAHLVRSSTL